MLLHRVQHPEEPRVGGHRGLPGGGEQFGSLGSSSSSSVPGGGSRCTSTERDSTWSKARQVTVGARLGDQLLEPVAGAPAPCPRAGAAMAADGVEPWFGVARRVLRRPGPCSVDGVTHRSRSPGPNRRAAQDHLRYRRGGPGAGRRLPPARPPAPPEHHRDDLGHLGDLEQPGHDHEQPDGDQRRPGPGRRPSTSLVSDHAVSAQQISQAAAGSGGDGEQQPDAVPDQGLARSGRAARGAAAGRRPAPRSGRPAEYEAASPVATSDGRSSSSTAVVASTTLAARDQALQEEGGPVRPPARRRPAGRGTGW